jgi:hypothetical protein
LLALQAEYADWLATLPESLRDSTTANALETVVDLDLTPLADIELPRGYGRDRQSTETQTPKTRVPGGDRQGTA